MIKFLSKAFGTGKKKNKTAKSAKPRRKTPPASGKAGKGAKPKAADAPKAGGDDAEPALSEREKLIQDALAIHREKSKILDDLPPAVRTKLTAMAMAIYIKQTSENKKN